MLDKSYPKSMLRRMKEKSVSKKKSSRSSSGKLGGKARAEALSSEQRKKIASEAAKERWNLAKKATLRATHKGNFREDFGIDVECYVLNDEAKTAVISQRSMDAALGFTNNGSRFLAFLNRPAVSQYVARELRQKIDKPLLFLGFMPGGNSVNGPVTKGYDVTILIDICKVILEAAGDETALGKRHEKVVQQANIILAASAKAGIKGLVYALAGYDATREEIITSFKMFVREEAREYESEFPVQLYNEWYRLYRLPRPARNKPWKFKQLTLDHVYHPLAKSNGRVLQLTRVQKASGPNRHAKLHQFLSEVGVKALRRHLGQLLGIAQVSDTRAQYESNIEKVFGSQLALPVEK